MMQKLGNAAISFSGYVERQFEEIIEVFADNFARTRSNPPSLPEFRSLSNYS